MLQQKWSLLSPKEQRLVLLGGIVILITVAYFYIWTPYNKHIHQYSQQVESLRLDIAWLKKIKQQTGHVTGQSKSKSRTKMTVITGSLINTIDTSIKQQQLDNYLDGLKKSANNQVSVAFKDIAFDSLMNWLIQLSHQSGIQVSAADIQKTNNTGRVYARLSLAKGN